MATYITNKDDLECCPYDPTHKVKSSRFHIHIIKCREKFQTQNKQVCPFNARHYVKESEFQHHLTICPDKDLVNKKVKEHSKNTVFKGKTAVPSYFGFDVPEEENWDNINNDDSCCLQDLNLYEKLQERSLSPISLNTLNSYESDKCDQDLNEHQSTSVVLKKEEQFEKPQKSTKLSKEKLLERSLQSVRQSRGIYLGRGRGIPCGIITDDKFSIPKNSVGLGRGIINSEYDGSLSHRNNVDISEKIKELINYLPPCEPGEIRNIPN